MADALSELEAEYGISGGTKPDALSSLEAEYGIKTNPFNAPEFQPFDIPRSEESYRPSPNVRAAAVGPLQKRMEALFGSPTLEGVGKNPSAGYTPLGPAGMHGLIYRAAMGEAMPAWIPEPSTQGVTKGLSNVLLGPMRVGMTGQAKLYGALGLEKPEQMARENAERVRAAAAWISKTFGQQEGSPTQSLSGQIIGESAPFLANPASPTIMASRGGIPALAARLGIGAAQGAGGATLFNPQEEARTPEEYAQAQASSAKLGALLGAGGQALGEVASPIARLLRGGKPTVDAAGYPAELERRIGGSQPSDVLQSELRKAHKLDKAAADVPFEALRARPEDVPMSQFSKNARELESNLLKLGRRKDDPIIKRVRDLRDQVVRAQDRGWTRALDVSDRLSSEITEADKAGRGYEKKLLIQLKNELDNTLPAEYKEAKTFWREKMAPWISEEEGSGYLRRVMDSPTPDKALETMARSKSGDEATIYFNRLTDKGKDAVRAQFVKDIVSAGDGSPTDILKAIKEARKRGVHNVFFEGDDIRKLNGLEKLYKYSARSGVASGVATGSIIAALTGEARSITGGYFGGRFLRKPIGRAAYKAFGSDAMQRLLLDADKFEDGSPELAALLQKLPLLAGQQESKLTTLLKGQ